MTYRDTDYQSMTPYLRNMDLGQTLIEPHIASYETFVAYKNAWRLAPKRFTLNTKTYDKHGNRLSILTRVA